MLAAGNEVVGIDSFSDYYARDRKEAAIAAARAQHGFALVERDLEAPLPAQALEDIAGIFHLAGRPGVRTGWGESFRAYVKDNILATHRVVEAAAERGRRLVFASSSSIYGDALAYPTPESAAPAPASPYGVTKLACEHLLGAYGRGRGLDYVTLRYFSVFGPRQRPDMAFSQVIEALTHGRNFEVFGDGHQSRDFTYVADAVAATVLAMRQAPVSAVYNVGGGSEASLREAVTTIEDLSGKTLDVSYREAAPGDVRRTLADTSRIRRELGWEPRVGLREGLASMLQAAGVPVSAPELAQ